MTGPLAILLPALAALPWPLPASDWTNAGGNAARNGSTSELGPADPTPLWSGGKPSIIAWQPVTEGDRAFFVRQASFVPSGVPDDSPVVAVDLRTGAELWSKSLPYSPGDWTTWIAGVKGGRVYASRSGNGASVSAKLHCLDAATGATLWQSDDPIDAGAYDGVVFAPDGDPIVASFRDIWRIDSQTGATVWRASRTCSVSGNCGAAVSSDAVYAVDTVPGGQVVERYDLATGNLQYASPVMPGFLVQNAPMVGLDGTIYFNRVQNNPSVDFFYAWRDDGTAFTAKWSVPAGYNTAVEYAVGPDGSVYMMAPGDVLQRLDPETGAVLASHPLGPSSSVRMATDALGRLYVSNGEFASGEVFCFEADLTLRWSVPVQNVNVGGPALGRLGTLLVCGIGSDVRAWRNPLAQDSLELAAAAGGAQELALHAPAHAGKTYWVAGSTSGTSPGLALGGFVLPLNPDPYFLFTVTQPGSPVLPGSLGTLDGAGEATVHFVLAPGIPFPSFPVEVNHAFAVVDLATATVAFTSNPSIARVGP